MSATMTNSATVSHLLWRQPVAPFSGSGRQPSGAAISEAGPFLTSLMTVSSKTRRLPVSAARQNAWAAISPCAPERAARRQHHQAATRDQPDRHDPPTQHFPAGRDASEPQSQRHLHVARAVWNDPQPRGVCMKWFQQRAEQEDDSDEISKERTEQRAETCDAEARPAEQAFQYLQR